MHVYPITIHQDDDPGVWADSPLVPEFFTAGDDVADLLDHHAQDGMVSALSIYQDQGRAIPVPDGRLAGTHGVALSVLQTAKVGLWNVMCDQGVSRAELGRRLGISAAMAGRLVDVLHGSRMDSVERALSVLGQRVGLTIEAA